MRFLPQTTSSSGTGLEKFPLTNDVHSEHLNKILAEELGDVIINKLKLSASVTFLPLEVYLKAQTLSFRKESVSIPEAVHALELGASNPYLKNIVKVQIMCDGIVVLNCSPRMRSEYSCCGTIYMGGLAMQTKFATWCLKNAATAAYLESLDGVKLFDILSEIMQLYVAELALMGHGMLHFTDKTELEAAYFPTLKHVAKTYGTSIHYPNPKYGSTEPARLTHYCLTWGALKKAYEETYTKLRYV